ncbi:MAG: hybrid sensor histidine kinase/response regulator [Gammaproteobacteria bacterium]|nr:hybrid sensor histidine kinase/response regulator [Gammaproteobacteria bacterium]
MAQVIQEDDDASARALRAGAAANPGDAVEGLAARRRTVLAERLQILNRNTLPILLVHLVLAAVVVLNQRESLPTATAYTWWMAVVFMVVLRLLLHRGVAARREWNDAALAATARQFVLTSGLAGALWGATALLFYPGSAVATQFLIVVILAGMGAGAVTSLVMYMPAFYAYLLPSLLPLAWVSLRNGEPAHTALGFATVVYALALCYFGRNFSRSLVESLELRYENVDLVKALRLRTRLADEANAAKSRFLAAASHDLRQPVHALSLFVDSLGNCPLDARSRGIAGQIDAAVGSLDRMFSSLLDISQLESGAVPVERVTVDVQPLVAGLVAEFAPQARDKGIAVETVILIEAVETDLALLERILRNLIANAVRYTDAGRIVISIAADGARARFEIRDSGRGIAAAEQGLIFEEFRKLDRTDRDPRKGLGLGLAIVKRAADLLGTRIDVSSAPGAGSTFAFDLPAARPGARIVSAAAARTTSATGELDDMRVLVVDDDLGILRGMRTLLRDWGCAVRCCDSAAAAEDAVAGGYRPDAVIVDYHLDDAGTGLDVIAALRARVGADVPAVIVTGDPEPPTSADADAAAVQILLKPAPPARIRSFLRSARRQAQGSRARG